MQELVQPRVARPIVGNSTLVVARWSDAFHRCGQQSIYRSVFSIPQQFESEISYDDPPTRKQRLLLPVPEHDQSTSTAGEDVEVEEDDEDTDEQESGEQ